MRLRSALLLALAAPLLAGCAAGAGTARGEGTPASAGRELVVFAASSLTDAFTEIGPAFEAAHPGLKVTFNFAGSPALRAQIEQGARADLFASADQAQMDLAKQHGIIAGPERVFTNNRLVVILPKSNPGRVERLQDLARPGLRVVTALANVPVGAYTRSALAKMSADPAFGADFEAAVLRNVVSEEDNVRQVVAKVQLGEADAGVVYASDVSARVAPDVRTLPIPDAYNTVATYPVAVTHVAREPALARAFIDYLLSPEGQATLRKHGFPGVS